MTRRTARVLVVDDNRVNRMLLARALQLEGHDVATAEHGREALDRVRGEPFDLVLLDMEMPELDGFGVLEVLHADPELRELPVIVTSGLEGIQHVARCIELGADDFLSKPVNPVLLRARVRSSLEKRWLREERRALLQREIAHQVAERSRALADALARGGGAPSRPGAAIDARYAVVRPLGEGGMGAVYEVVRRADGARLALKVMTGAVSREAATRFAREAEIGARVHDPHVVAIVDLGVTDDGAPYLVMELAPGGSLEAQRARFGDPAWALPVVRRIARGLAALHAAGVVHRDLKPANVLLDAHGAAKVSDFGIARFVAVAVALDPLEATRTGPMGDGLTGTGALLGTPLYMAPEAARGAPVTPAADVFALGLLAHELLTGARPFPRPPMLLAFAGQPLPTLPPLRFDGIAPAVLDTLAACLRDAPEARPSIEAVIAALG